MGVQSKFSLFRTLRTTLFCLLGLLLVVLAEPHLFRYTLRLGVIVQAARHGQHLEIGEVEGSLVEPVVFRDIWLVSTRAAVTSKVSVNSAQVAFSWGPLLKQKGRGFFDRLTLDGVHADVTFQPYAKETGPEPTPAQLELEFQPWLPLPTHTEVVNSNFYFHIGNRNLIFEDVRLTVSSSKEGIIAVEKLTLEQGYMSRSFKILRGATALQGSRLRVADITLSDGVLLKSLSCDLDDMARGRLQVDYDFDAFGGSLRGEILNTTLGQRPAYDIAGSFSNISVEALGKFLSAREKTGGIIKEGRFTFRGSPHELENATFSTRLEAKDFRWGSRQWSSLVFGATVVDRRVQIPELELQQAHNTLHLKGEMAIPGDETPWWLSDFSFDIAARLDNLAELSALFGPQFADVAGKMTLDGSIRSFKKSYAGQLLVSGSKLSWRGVPFDLLNAGIKLDGNELQILTLEATHGADFVRGKGTVNILGERRYQGELNASIEDLAVYKPLLQKPIVPAPPGGGLVVKWSGDGNAEAHSGAFTAHFRKLHTLRTEELSATLPIDADIEGTYGPGALALNKCALANEETRFEGRLAADEKALKLDALKLTQNKAVWLEGSATLPFNLFKWWVNPAGVSLNPDAPIVARVSAKGIQLEEAAHLTGRQMPVRGLLTGTVQTESTLRNLRINGSLKLTKGQFPASDWLPALDKLEAEAEIDGNVLRFSKFSASNPMGDFSGTGSLDFSKFDATKFDLLLHGEKVRFNAGPSWAGSANLDLTVSGMRDAASVNGSAEVVALETTPRPHFGALINSGNPETIRVAAPAISLNAPFNRWNYRVSVTASEPVVIKDGTVAADLLFSGTGSPLAATGSITFAGLPAGTSYTIGKLESGTWQLGANPYVVARLTGKFLGENSIQKFDGYFLGSPECLASNFAGQSNEDDELIRIAFTPGAKPLPADTAKLPIEVNPVTSKPLLPVNFSLQPKTQTALKPAPTPPPPPPKPVS